MRNDEAWPYREFMERIDALRLRKGLQKDTVFAKVAGVHPTMIGKWRSGVSRPTLESLRNVAHGLGLTPVKVWMWAGLMDASDLGMPAIPQVYQDAIDLDSDLPDPERDIMRTHVQFLVDGTRARLAAQQDGPSNIRRKTTSE